MGSDPDDYSVQRLKVRSDASFEMRTMVNPQRHSVI